MKMNNSNEVGQLVLRQASEAIGNLAERLDGAFNEAVELILNCQGRLIVSGMGKSGHIGKKIAATMASTGTTSFFVHPAEAFHGDLGMIRKNDVVLLISNSGETEEVIKLIPSLRSFGNRIISVANNPESTLAKNSDIYLDINVEKEACPNNLAPTTSTTVTLALGDALAVSLMKARNFQPEHFAAFHPGGSLGRRLLTRVKDEMMSENLPLVSKDTPLNEVVITMTQSLPGIALVVDERKNLLGVITDGDLRRTLLKGLDLNTTTAGDIMTNHPVTINENAMLVEAEDLMKEHSITKLVVVDQQEQVAGVLEI
jgi:arabinose-5-phosphate isomerase